MVGLPRQKINGHVSSRVSTAKPARQKRSLERFEKSNGRTRPRSEKEQASLTAGWPGFCSGRLLRRTVVCELVEIPKNNRGLTKRLGHVAQASVRLQKAAAAKPSPCNGSGKPGRSMLRLYKKPMGVTSGLAGRRQPGRRFAGFPWRRRNSWRCSTIWSLPIASAISVKIENGVPS